MDDETEAQKSSCLGSQNKLMVEQGLEARSSDSQSRAFNVIRVHFNCTLKLGFILSYETRLMVLPSSVVLGLK